MLSLRVDHLISGFSRGGQLYNPTSSSIRDHGVVLKVERFFHLSCRSFGFDSFIGFGYLSLVFSLRANVVGKEYLVP